MGAQLNALVRCVNAMLGHFLRLGGNLTTPIVKVAQPDSSKTWSLRLLAWPAQLYVLSLSVSPAHNSTPPPTSTTTSPLMSAFFFNRGAIAIQDNLGTGAAVLAILLSLAPILVHAARCALLANISLRLMGQFVLLFRRAATYPEGLRLLF